MTKRIRVHSATILGVAAFVAQAFIFQACGGNNNPSSPGSGGTSSPGSAGNGQAGTTGVGGTMGVGGTTGTGGSIAGTTGTGGTADNDAGSGFGQPACPSTVSKGGACAATDVQFCYKTCGPEKSGVKSETCQTSGTYAEMSGCSFDPSKTFECYKIPATANTACPAGVTPQGSMDCSTYNVDPCVVCNSTQGTQGGGYLDSTGAQKVGYCVCQAANASGARVWSCASDTAWPCPSGAGC